MEVIYGLENIKQGINRPVVTIGIFDGVHLGHQYTITRVVRCAQEMRLKSLVLTFDPHPLKILTPLEMPSSHRETKFLTGLTPKKPAPLLISLKHRLKLIAKMGVDICLVMEFNKAFSQIMPEEFVKNILVERLGVSVLFVGQNFSFGKSAAGDILLLKELSKKYNFKVACIRLLKLDGKDISSTRIRSLIERGSISQAAKFLGRPVSVLGTVIKGTARGRLIGYPTANIDPHHEVMPPPGVYVVRVTIVKNPFLNADDRGFNSRITADYPRKSACLPVRQTGNLRESALKEKELFGVSNIGRRPTFVRQPREKPEPTVEVHIFDFNEDIYGQDLEVFFLKKLRDEKKFANKDELVRRIKKDEGIAKDILSRALKKVIF